METRRGQDPQGDLFFALCPTYGLETALRRIVAMMASAMQGDGEMCLQAGMDHHVGKLIRPADMAAALEGQPYDVVLMDVQMLEMDGLEATKAIYTRWPGSEHPRIVAMTAGAMQSDREMCVAAGMDDYVSKPIHMGSSFVLVEVASTSPRTFPIDVSPSSAFTEHRFFLCLPHPAITA